MIAVDLFAGPGGWDEGLAPLGLHPLGIEWDAAACATRERRGHRTLQADVAALEPRNYPCELLMASPPCPTFSNAGKRGGLADMPLIRECAKALLDGRDTRAETLSRLSDGRSLLVVEPLRWALALRPALVALEQVPAVLPLWELFADGLLTLRRTLPRATAPWALDSGGFTELSLYGAWRTAAAEYVADVRRFEAEVGQLAWVAPQDWMCEPFMVGKTRLSVQFHQQLTVENFVRLREELGELVIPVLQGWTLADYQHCWGYYENEGVDLQDEPLVGLGSVCRRQNMAEAGRIVRGLAPLALHGFGVKLTGLESYGDALASADSMAWSFDGRRLKRPCPEGRSSCANCVHHALSWRRGLLSRMSQLRLEVA